MTSGAVSFGGRVTRISRWLPPRPGGTGAFPQRIAIVTDAWLPQMNGVVRTLSTTCEHCATWARSAGGVARAVHASVPVPDLSRDTAGRDAPGRGGGRLREFSAGAIHIATEGPLGIRRARLLARHAIRFTTAYHTQFPDYLASARTCPRQWFWRYIRMVPSPARSVLVATDSISRNCARTA